MHCRLLIATLGIMLIGGCCHSAGSHLTVPANAKLLAYGYNSQPAPIHIPGTVYLYDEDKDQVAGAVYTPDGKYNFTTDAGHKYRIYFVPDASLQPATMPTK